MPRLLPFDWALRPATALPRLSEASSSYPRRSATTAAHRVITGARLILILRAVIPQTSLTVSPDSSRIEADPRWVGPVSNWDGWMVLGGGVQPPVSYRRGLERMVESEPAPNTCGGSLKPAISSRGLNIGRMPVGRKSPRTLPSSSTPFSSNLK